VAESNPDPSPPNETKKFYMFIDDTDVSPHHNAEIEGNKLPQLMNSIKNHENFVSFSAGVDSNFDISQSAYQNVLRNHFGKH
jgi:hypothetical protein